MKKNEMGGHIVRMRNESAYKTLLGKPEGKKSLGRPRRRWRTILEWNLRKQGGKVWTGFIWFRIGTSSGYESSSSLKGGEFPDYLIKYLLTESMCEFC
jgi:hypothetical protein